MQRSSAGSIITQRADEEEEEEDEGDDLDETSTSSITAVRSTQPASKKTKKTPGDLASVLSEYLAQSRKEQEAVNAQVLVIIPVCYCCCNEIHVP